MKTHHSTARICLALMIGTLLIAFSSCKKSPNTIGNNLISGDEFINVFRTDTVEVVCHSNLDSVATKNVSSALLGAMKDPIFGTTEAGFYTQFRPSVAGHSFGNNPIMDSLVLQLNISDYYGDTTTLQTAHVYLLTDTLSFNETYYSNDVLATDAFDHASSHQFYPHPHSKGFVIGSDTIGQPVVRIPLSDDLGNMLMGLDSTSFSRPDLFKEYFHGLYVTCSEVSQNGSICYLNLTNNSFSVLQLYYHDAATPEKPMRYNFYITSSDTYFNHFDHDYTQGSPEFVSQVLEGQSEQGQQVAYLQTMGGVRTWIQFPNVDHWTDTLEHGHLIINEAKLILPAQTLSLDSIFKTPTNFSLVGLNADSSIYLLPDYYEGNAYFGGSYNTSNQTVSFHVSEYLQSVIMKKQENIGLSLGINGASYSATRFVVNGPNAPVGEKMRLEITYSIVNE